VLFLFEDVLI